jgi:hypothetical protein
MTAPMDAGAHRSNPSPGSQRFRSGTLLIIGLGIFLLVGWIFYRQTLPPAWLHDFSEAIALHAAPDPNPAAPEDIRQVSPRREVGDPYICLSRVIDLAWDHFFVITSGEALRNHQVLSNAIWQDQSLSYYVDLLERDERYQLVVLIQHNDVVDAQLYFTFWGDLSAIAMSEGFARDNAIFTAASLGGIYIVSPALDAPIGACS